MALYFTRTSFTVCEGNETNYNVLHTEHGPASEHIHMVIRLAVGQQVSKVSEFDRRGILLSWVLYGKLLCESFVVIVVVLVVYNCNR